LNSSKLIGISKLKLNNVSIENLCLYSTDEFMNLIFKYKIFYQQVITLVNNNELFLNKDFLLDSLYFKGKEDRMKLLINYGAKVNHVKSKLFFYIVSENDLEMAKYVIDKGAYINYYQYKPSDGLLIWDAISNNDMVKLLIRHGADLFINDTEYEKILELAMDDEVNILPYLKEYHNCFLYNFSEYFKKSTLSYAIENKN